MRYIASPAEVFWCVWTSFLVECALGRIRNKGQDGRCGSTKGDGGDTVDRADTNTRRTELNDMMFEVPILIGAPFEHTLGTRELSNLFEPRVNPILVSLIKLTILTNENLLKFRISVLVLGFPHIERKSRNEFLTCFAFKDLSIGTSFATQTFKGLKSRRRILKFVVSTKLHRENAMGGHITIAFGHMINKFLPGIKHGMQIATNRQ